LALASRLCIPVVLCLALASPSSLSSASTSVAPDERCPGSAASDGAVLSAGFGANDESATVIDHGDEAMLAGQLLDGSGRGVPNAFVCIYSNVVTSQVTEFAGIVSTDAAGRYRFPVPSGPSRNLTAVYRSSQGPLSAWALLQARAIPTLRLAKTTIHNKHYARFSGEIPGPYNDGVVVVLQVKIGKGWRVFRRYTTRDGGKFKMRYRFNRNFTPTLYLMRAQIAGAPGYPFLPGNSRPVELTVYP
jgi:hypothetical protein